MIQERRRKKKREPPLNMRYLHHKTPADMAGVL